MTHSDAAELESVARDVSVPGSPVGQGTGAGGRQRGRVDPLWKIALSLMPVLPLLTLSVAGSVIFLASLPIFSGNYFAQHIYHGSPDVNCGDPSVDPSSPAGVICHQGFGKAASYSGDAAGVASFLTFLLAPSIGQSSDRIGRKWFLVASQVLAAIPFVLMYLAVHSDGVLLYPYYAFTGLQGCISLSAVALGYSADRTSGPNRSAGFGMIIGAVSLALIGGPIISEYVTLDQCTYAALCMAMFSVVWSLFIPESLPASRRRQDVPAVPLNPIKPLLILTRSTLFIQLAGAVFYNSVCEAAKLSILGFYLQESLALTQNELNVWIVVLGLSGALAQFVLLRPALRLVGATNLFRIGIVGTCLDTLCWGVAGQMPNRKHGLALLYVSTILFSGVGYFAFPSVSAIKSNNAAAQEQGQIQGALFGVRTLASGATQFTIPHIYAKMAMKHVPNLLYASCAFGVAALVIAIQIVQTDEKGRVVASGGSVVDPKNDATKPLLDSADADVVKV